MAVSFSAKEWKKKQNSRHNVIAFLDPKPEQAIPYRQLLSFLERSRIIYSLTASVDMYLDQLESFYNNATISVDDGDVPRIVSNVLGHAITITQDTVRNVLQFDDAGTSVTKFDTPFIHGALLRMGYPRKELVEFRKPFLSRVWKYLCHLVIVCLSPRKGGFDAASFETLSLMLALVYNKPYSFSGYVFGNLVENIRAGKDKWFLYPRFLQLIINSHNFEIAKDDRSIYELTPMILRIYKDMHAPPKDVLEPLADVPLFGHIVNPNYVAPPNDGFLDVGESQVNEENLFDAAVHERELEADLRDIDAFEQVEESDGGVTPPGSPGDVPPQHVIDGVEITDPRRFKRICRRISARKAEATKSAGKRPVESSSDYAKLPKKRKSSSSGVVIEEPRSQSQSRQQTPTRPAPQQQQQPRPQPSADLQLVLSKIERLTNRVEEQSSRIGAQAKKSSA